MASSGLLTTITTACGLDSRIWAATSPTIFAFVESRSSRLMPGLRAMPAVTTTTSLPAVSAQFVVPVSRESKPMIGDAWKRSSALPAGMPSVAGMSSRTMSPSSALAHQWAVVAPTLPAPMMEIFARRMMEWFLERDAWDGIPETKESGEQLLSRPSPVATRPARKLRESLMACGTIRAVRCGRAAPRGPGGRVGGCRGRTTRRPEPRPGRSPRRSTGRPSRGC